MRAISRAVRCSGLIAAALFALFVPSVQAHDHPSYSHDEGGKTSNPDWMGGLKDDTTLSQLSIPGTHDTMARYGGDITQTQSMLLATQLESGIRVLDIRCRHIDDAFAIHHGLVYQQANFDDVLTTVRDFLGKHPGETVLMRVQEEYTPQNTTRSFEQTFVDRYWNKYPGLFWTPTSENPTLGELRGKVVVLQSFPANGRYGLNYGAFQKQDNYNLKTNWDLYDKWTAVKDQLNKANQGDKNTIYINYLSGSGGSFPYFVASGHSSPGTGAPRLATGKTTPGWSDWPDFPRVNCLGALCTIAFEGTNTLTYDWLGGQVSRAGIIMADFPGPGLIERIINLDKQFSK